MGKPSYTVESYLDAMGAMWLATGETIIDTKDPISVLAGEIYIKVPNDQYRDWLFGPNELLGERTPLECMREDDLTALFDELQTRPVIKEQESQIRFLDAPYENPLSA